MKGRSVNGARIGRDKRHGAAKQKALIGQPWLLAFALRADGWWLRSEVIWAKRSVMPESVIDRPTKAPETMFLFAKSQRYYYDAEAVREEAQYGRRTWSRQQFKGGDLAKHHGKDGGSTTGGDANSGRNLRDVWWLSPEPFPGTHFATFPRALVEPCIKAGTSDQGVCPKCGAPRKRVGEKGEPVIEHQKACGGDSSGNYSGKATKDFESAQAQDASEVKRRTLEGMRTRSYSWKRGCRHRGDPVPATVLDPFAGSGTTGVVANALGRDFVGVELNPDYAEMARKRIRDDRPMFNRVELE